MFFPVFFFIDGFIFSPFKIMGAKGTAFEQGHIKKLGQWLLFFKDLKFTAVFELAHNYICFYGQNHLQNYQYFTKKDLPLTKFNNIQGWEADAASTLFNSIWQFHIIITYVLKSIAKSRRQQSKCEVFISVLGIKIVITIHCLSSLQ